MADKKIEPGRHFVSKTYIPITVCRGFWAALFLVVIGVINIFAEGGSEVLQYATAIKLLPLFIIGGFILVLGIIAVIAFISYKRLTWEITDEELHIYKGILIKKKSHIPFRRIHSVDINAKILDRIFGVVTVKLDTAAGSATKEDAKIPALHLSTAELLRTEIFQRKNIIENGQDMKTVKGGGNILEGLNSENENLRGIYAGGPQNLTAKAEYRFSNKELILYCLANGKAFAIIFALLLFASQFLSILRAVNEDIGESAGNMANMLFSVGPIIIVGIFIVALLISIVISFITRALTYGNFIVKRYDARVEVSTGLIQKKSTGVAVERIQTLKIKQGLLHRILGYAEISIETASGMGPSGGNEQQSNPGVIIHPFIKANKVEDFMSKMLNEFTDRPDKLKGLTGLAMRRSIIRYGLWSMLLVILPANLCWRLVRDHGLEGEANLETISMIGDIIMWSSIVLLLFMLILGWAVWKGRAYSHNTRYVAMRKGIIGRTKIFIPKLKIQYAQVSQNPFQKRFDLATIKANTAALGASNESMKDVRISEGDDYLQWIEHSRTDAD